MLSSRQEVQRLAEFEDRYELVKPAVDELIDLRLRTASNKNTRGYINQGSNVVAYKVSVGGLDLAVRLSKTIMRGKPGSYIESRARAMARSQGIDCVEQGYAMDRGTGIIVSHFVDGVPHHDRGARGGLWLFAEDVGKLVNAQEQLRDAGARRDGGSKGNLLAGEAGLTLVDILDSAYPVPEAEERLIPELLFSFSRPRRVVEPSELQATELKAIADMFESRYPDSHHLPDVRAALDSYSNALEDSANSN